MVEIILAVNAADGNIMAFCNWVLFHVAIPSSSRDICTVLRFADHINVRVGSEICPDKIYH